MQKLYVIVHIYNYSLHSFENVLISGWLVYIIHLNEKITNLL